MSRHQPVSPFERSVFHRQGSAGALRFNAVPLQAIAPVANVQALAPAVNEPDLVRPRAAVEVINPAKVMDGRSRRAPRGIMFDAVAFGALVYPLRFLIETSNDTWHATYRTLTEEIRGESVNPTYALPAEWSTIYVIGDGSVEALRKALRFVY